VCDYCNGAFNLSALSIPTDLKMRDLVIASFRRSAVAVLKAGNPESPAARAALIGHMKELFDSIYRYDEEVLDQDLLEADPQSLAIYLEPIRARFTPETAEIYIAKCADIALADGSLSDSEFQALRSIANGFDLSDVYLRGILSTAQQSSTPRVVAPSVLAEAKEQEEDD
jgi:hypothetical protein